MIFNKLKSADLDNKTAKKQLKHNVKLLCAAVLCIGALCAVLANIPVHAAPGVTIDFNADAAGDNTMGALDVMFMFVLIALLPSILLMMTSFTRIIIILSFMRNALGTQQSPPNQVLVGLALFLTLFIMMPVIDEINKVAYTPYKAGDITQQEALDKGVVPIKKFMLKQTKVKSLNLYLSLSKTELPLLAEDEPPDKLVTLPLNIVVPAFMTSELERAFLIGFYLYLPFLIIDIVVSSVLMSMGMVMLPPAMISLPFKILMFVLVDGWSLLMGTIAMGFGMG
ncbi:MAG: flagellar type III secretion system pore protein FliP [Oscillospiraceae bacterium]